jgi:hypothetical protein
MPSPPRIAVAAALLGLALAAPAAADTTRTATPPAALSAYYDSGQWAKDISAKVKRAKANLRKDLSADRPPRRPAIVLDIDETSLFNAPCFEEVDWELAGLVTCQIEGRGVATPVRALYDYARAKRVTVAFVTGRFEPTRSMTKRNLNDQGYDRGYKLTFRPLSDTNTSRTNRAHATTSSTTATRSSPTSATSGPTWPAATPSGATGCPTRPT